MAIFVCISSVFLITSGYKKILKCMYPIKYEEYVSEASAKYKVKKSLIYAVIKCESNFDENAHSHANAQGLMQITEETFEWLNLYEKEKYDPELIKNPRINILRGTLLISVLMKMYSDINSSLCAYNAGVATVDRWLSDKNISKDGKHLSRIPYHETDVYLKKVKHAEKMYNKIYFQEEEI